MEIQYKFSITQLFNTIFKMIIYYKNLYTVLNIEFNKLILNLRSKQLKTN